MSVLNVLFLVGINIICGIFASEVVFDILFCRLLGFCGNSYGVGSDVGHKTHGALTLYFHALVELLRNHHGLLCCKSQLVRRILLQAAGGKRCKRFAAPLLPDDFRCDIFAGFQSRKRLVRFFLASDGDFLILIFCKPSGENLVLLEIHIDIPIFFWHKCLDFVFSIANDLQCCRLNPACTEAPAYLAPKKRAYLIAHKSVKNSSCLLRVNKP